MPVALAPCNGDVTRDCFGALANLLAFEKIYFKKKTEQYILVGLPFFNSSDDDMKEKFTKALNQII